MTKPLNRISASCTSWKVTGRLITHDDAKQRESGKKGKQGELCIPSVPRPLPLGMERRPCHHKNPYHMQIVLA